MNINIDRYKFAKEALTGDGGFLPQVITDGNGNALFSNRSHLVKYPREDYKKFARRNELAWYENHLLPACQRFVGYLAKKPPLRDLPNPLIEDFAADCNWRGDALDVFWQNFMIEAKARGCMLLLVDMPQGMPANQADQHDERFFPYLVPIAPENIKSYTMTVQGRMASVEYHDTTTDGKSIIRGWDANGWWVKNESGALIEGDRHHLGECPVLIFSESGDFPFIGPFVQIADLSKRLFNLRSELDEILRSQTFSLLTYQVPAEASNLFDAGSVAQAIGTHNMLVHHGATPQFIAPPDGPATIYLDAISHVEKAIARIALAVELPDKKSAESGIALTIRFQSLNASLTSFARRMEDMERNVLRLVSGWLGLGAVGTCEWAKDYALADLAAEMATLSNMIATGMPEVVNQQQRKVITQLAFPTLDQDQMDALIDAIDNSTAEIAPQEIDPTMELTATKQPPVDLSPILDAIKAIQIPEQQDVPDDSATVSALSDLSAQIIELSNKPIDLSPVEDAINVLGARIEALESVEPDTAIADQIKALSDQVAALSSKHEPKEPDLTAIMREVNQAIANIPKQAHPVMLIDPQTGAIKKQITLTFGEDGKPNGAVVEQS